jgi:transcriptional regulator with XRE-family HTH domain/tetratricopeptide (TPR) repeat protein
MARGYSQLRVAERLCAASGLPTVSRHEVSRWEREERVPGSFWLGWLAVVLDTPLEGLETAVAVARHAPTATASGVTAGPGHGPVGHRLWSPATAVELLAVLDHGTGQDLRELAHTWLAGPPDPAPAPISSGRFEPVGADRAPLDALASRLPELRRMDDLVGGLDLDRLVDRELRAATAALRAARGAGRQRRAVRLVAEFAQLAGWVHADADDPAAARRAYGVALRAASAGGDRPLAAHVLGALSHLSYADGDPHEALLLARTAYAGVRTEASGYTQALLQHRVAIAAARLGERRAAHAALAAAERAADRSRPDQEPSWLYWLDQAELSAMTGRCLVVLGRPLRAARLLATPRAGLGPRAASLYAGWLARSYLELGEVEQACQIALRALGDAVRAGSARAATGLRHLHPMLLRHRDVSMVRLYERLAARAAPYLPAPPGGRRPAGLSRPGAWERAGEVGGQAGAAATDLAPRATTAPGW